MTIKLNQKGFSFVEGLLVLIALTLVVGVGFYVFNANKDDKKDSVTSSQKTETKETKPATAKLTAYELPQEKLKMDYDNSYWKVSDSSSGNIDCQAGSLKQDTLSLSHGEFTLSFRFGQCPGKGGGICFNEPNSGCIRESKNMGEVNIAQGKKWYVLAGRTTTDSGKNWEYDLWLNDEPNCTDDLCLVPATNIEYDDLSSVYGEYTNKSNASSLDQYVQLPEIKAAVELLKTVKY